MEGDGSSTGPSRLRKLGGTRRTWNEKEEDILMAELKELVASGCWKGENGFRPGYANKLEEMMMKRLPGTDIRATPHINSKIQTWKKLHGCLQTALGETECGFNTVTKIMDVSDIAWAKVLKKDPSIGSMRYKPWPYYEDWLEVFGNDRANGSNSENLMDAVNTLFKEDNEKRKAATKLGESNDRANSSNSENLMDAVNTLFKEDNEKRKAATEPGESNVIPDGDDSCDMDVTSESPSVRNTASIPKTGKRKSSAIEASSGENKELIEAIGGLFKCSDDRLENIANVIGYKAKLAMNRNEVYTIVESIPQLSMDECLTATDMLCMNTRHLDMFMGLPERARYRYVQKLLAGDFSGGNAST